jgi:membrane-associated phospholipid phosphatase
VADPAADPARLASVASVSIHSGALGELDGIDQAVYRAIAATTSPTLDRGLRRLSSAADHSTLWLAVAATLALQGGRPRRAALLGVASIGLASATVNIVAKGLLRRARPDRAGVAVPAGRKVRMPASTSFPSGHSASAFAFATAVGDELPLAWLPLHALAAAVAYSRVHTGVHYPGDAVIGSLMGTGAAVAIRYTGRVVARPVSGLAECPAPRPIPATRRRSRPRRRPRRFPRSGGSAVARAGRSARRA